MKNNFFYLSRTVKCGLFVLLLTIAGSSRGQVRSTILCYGDRITLGRTMLDSLKNRYPAQLQYLLGEQYKISVQRAEGGFIGGLEIAARSKPSILFLEADSIKEHFSTAIEMKLNLLKNTGVRVVVLWPFLNATGAKEALDRIALRAGTELLDISRQLAEGDEKFYPNGDLSPIGASVVARRLYEFVQLKADSDFNVAQNLKLDTPNLNFHGFEGYTFSFHGREAKIIRPKVTATGQPWVWRARFWGHEPQVDIGLLERGYHVVYCDVSELFGNDEALKIWDGFYHRLHTAGLSKKAAMEGMSRGGVYIYNWCLRYPDRVSAIYADAPVLDFKSWPGGKTTGKGNKSDWETFKQDYGLTETQAWNFKQAPIDYAKVIAGFKIPLLHVVGDKDDVVPLSENTLPFAEKIRRAGGTISLIHKPNVGHHPHCLADPSPIIDFILKADNRKVNFASIASPGAEYRSGAGWSPNKGWWGEYRDINQLLDERKGKLDILFMGNSITQGIGGGRHQVVYKPGFAIFNRLFSTYSWECAGIAGDRTQQVLWRLKHGQYKTSNPKIIVLTIGVNNIIAGDDAQEIYEGILAIKNWINDHMPNTKLLLLGPLPVGLTNNDPRRIVYDQIHARLKLLSTNRKFTYYPMNIFRQHDGSLSTEDYASDGIHLKEKGYEKWGQEFNTVIRNLMAL